MKVLETLPKAVYRFPACRVVRQRAGELVLQAAPKAQNSSGLRSIFTVMRGRNGRGTWLSGAIRDAGAGHHSQRFTGATRKSESLAWSLEEFENKILELPIAVNQ